MLEYIDGKPELADEVKPCKTCGKPMLFAWRWDEARKPVAGPVFIPLDAKAPVYALRTDTKGNLVRDKEGRAICDRLYVGMVNHHATCPKADEAHPERQQQADLGTADQGEDRDRPWPR